MAASVVDYIGLAEGDQSGEVTRGSVVGIVVRQADGSVATSELHPKVARAIQKLLEVVQGGGRVAVLDEEEELSPNDAARILGMSRPLVVRRMDTGDLPFRYEGAHRRCKLKDVLALKSREATRQKAIDELAGMTEELMAEHGLS